MLRSLWSAASGMLAQQLNVDTISNNLSNVNTPGFKKSRVQFQDLFYQALREPGTTSVLDALNALQEETAPAAPASGAPAPSAPATDPALAVPAAPEADTPPAPEAPGTGAGTTPPVAPTN